MRDVHVESPFDATLLYTFRVRDGGVVTSGISRRSGVVQATAVAPSAFEAEWRAKAALLAGPEGAARWLPHGGLVVRDDGSHAVLAPLDAHTTLPGSSQASAG